MKNLKKLLIFLIIGSSTLLYSQEKLKGNREVSSVDRNLSEFNIIEVVDDIEVVLNYNEHQSVKVEADSNLHDAILTEINNGILTIKTNAKILRKKELKVHIKVNRFINEINAYNSAKVSSQNSLIIDTLSINAYDNSKFDVRLNCKRFHLNSKKTSDLSIALLSDVGFLRLEESSKVKGTIDTKEIEVTALDRSMLNVEGSVSYAVYEANGNADIKGKNFECNEALVKASNSASVAVNALENIDIFATNSSKIYLYSDPKITISEFYDKASLLKKENDKKLF